MRLEESTTIEADAARAWGYVADFGNDPEWRDAVSEMTPTPPGPVHVGQSVIEVLTFQGTTYVTETWVRSVDERPESGTRQLSFEGAGDGTRVQGSRTVTEVGPQVCRVSSVLTVRLRGPRRLIEPVMGILYRRLVREDLARLRQRLEEGSRAPEHRVDGGDGERVA